MICIFGLKAIFLMQSSWISADQLAQLSNDAEQAFISPLPAFSVIRISGPDQKKYLQGQLTCDVNSLQPAIFLRGAHCDAKGKMWSQFYLADAGEQLVVTAFRDELAASGAQWKKFGVFSKVGFETGQQHYAVFGLSCSEGSDNSTLTALINQLGFERPAKSHGVRRSQMSTRP